LNIVLFKIIGYRLDSTVVSINNESLDTAVKIRNDDSNVSTPIADNSTVSANDERKKRRPAPPPPPRPPSATSDVLSNILNSINLSLFQQASNNNTITDSQQQQLIDGSQHFMSPSGEAMEILEDLYDVLNNQENADRQYPVFAEREFGQTLCG
jgi:hypothetical protein